MAEIVFLGSAPGYPTPYRNHSSFLLWTANHKVLIDAGEPCSRTLLELGCHPAEIDAVLITHGHSDHTAGLPMLIQTSWIVGRKEPLIIYSPRELIEPLINWLDACYIGPAFIPFELEFRPWEHAAAHEVCGLKITPFPTTHLQSLRKKFAEDRFHAFGLEIRMQDYHFVASGDLGVPIDLKPALAQTPNLLITEVAHFPPEELFAFLRPFRLPRVAVTHASAEILEQPHSLIALAEKMLPETDVLFVEDRVRLPLGRC